MLDPNSSSLSFFDCIQSECYWGRLVDLYSHVHLPLSVFICTIGSILNVFNVVVFTRPKMRTPVNIFLASLSVAQCLFMLNYFFFALLEYFRALCNSTAWTYAFTFYKTINLNVNVVLHAVTFAHILAVSAFRIRSMQPPIQLNQFLFGNDWALYSVLFVWIFAPIFCIPVYFISSVNQLKTNNYTTCLLEQAFEHRNVEDKMLVGTVYWMFAVVLKLLPSLFAVFLFLALVRLPLSSEEFRRRLRDSQQKSEHQRKVSSSSKRSLATNHHPTWTLACLLVIAFLIECPHGVYNLYVATKNHQFEFSLLTRGQASLMLEFLILLQHTISFPIYYLTLVQFRETLHHLLNRNDRIKLEIEKPLSKKRAADSVMLLKEKRKRKLTKASDFDEEGAMTAKTSTVSRPHGPYPTIIISSNETRNITKLTF